MAGEDGAVWLGRVEGDRVTLIQEESRHPSADAVREALAASVDLRVEGPTVELAAVRLLAPIVRPSQIVCVGLNYADHAKESGADLPERPLLFAKSPSSIVGPGEPIHFSAAQSTQVDYEAELAVVVGRHAVGDLADPLEYILGYTVCNDVSARDAQFADGQWHRGKSLDSFCPLGPWIVTPDEVADVQTLKIGTTIGNETLQDGTTADMIFTVAEVVRYIARYITLHPGDVIATGTPYGVGFARQPPRFMVDGDVVRCWVDGIGELANPVRTT